MRARLCPENDLVDDTRGSRPSLAIGGGAIAMVLIAVAFRASSPTAAGAGKLPARGLAEQAIVSPPAPDEPVEFVRTVLGLTEDVWKEQFRALGRAYTEPRLVLYDGQVTTGCGVVRRAAGPFYCPDDQKIYLDLDFFRELKVRGCAPGDFARAYVLAHEVGHHVQQLLGTLDTVRRERGKLSPEEADKLHVRLELQADFLAGYWAYHADRSRQILEPGDLESARAAAAALGEGRPGPGSCDGCWSGKHGTAQQRLRWFTRGFETGDLKQGDTFQGEL